MLSILFVGCGTFGISCIVCLERNFPAEDVFFCRAAGHFCFCLLDCVPGSMAFTLDFFGASKRFFVAQLTPYNQRSDIVIGLRNGLFNVKVKRYG